MYSSRKKNLISKLKRLQVYSTFLTVRAVLLLLSCSSVVIYADSQLFSQEIQEDTPVKNIQPQTEKKTEIPALENTGTVKPELPKTPEVKIDDNKPLTAQNVDKPEVVQELLNGRDDPLKYWKFYSADQQVRLEETFFIATNGDPKEPILVCKGKPFGYLRLKEECENYEFSFEWKYAKDPNGNSGILIHVNGEDKIWPKSMQVQLHRPTAGSIFPSGGAKCEASLKLKDIPVKEAEWNSCMISSENGKVAVTINGQKQGEVKGCEPPSGAIALQCEGAEIHFRKLTLKKLKSNKIQVPPPVVNPNVPPAKPAVMKSRSRNTQYLSFQGEIVIPVHRNRLPRSLRKNLICCE